MPHGKTTLIRQKKKKVPTVIGRQVEIKYKHKTQRVREGKGGGPEVYCAFCNEWIELPKWWVHDCKKADQ